MNRHFYSLLLASVFITVLLFFLVLNLKNTISILSGILEERKANDELCLCSQFQSDFATSFKPRQFLITLYEKAYYHTYHEIPSKSIYLSAPIDANHTFLTRHPGNDPNRIGIRYDFINNLFNGGFSDFDKNVERAAENLLEAKAFLEGLSGIPLVLSFPVKPILQRDKLPKFLRSYYNVESYNNNLQNAILRQLPKEFSSKYILDCYNEAIVENKHKPLIPQYNFHWVERSTYTNIISASIAKSFGKTNTNAVDKAYFKKETIASDIAHLTNIVLPEIEFDRIPEDYYTKAGVMKLGRNHFRNPNNKGKIIVFGDSFAMGLRKDLALYFGEVYTYGNKDHEINETTIYLAINNYTPDYYVFFSCGGLHNVSFTIRKIESLITDEIKLSGPKFKDTPALLVEGWYVMEAKACWSDSSPLLGFPEIAAGQTVTITYHPFKSIENLNVYALKANEKISILNNYNAKAKGFSFVVREEYLNEKGGLLLSFEINGALSPSSLGINEDTRILGISLRDVQVK